MRKAFAIATDSDILDALVAARTQKTITLRVRRDASDAPYVDSNDSYFQVEKGKLCEVTFQLVNEGGFTSLRFQDPAVTFVEPAPALAIALTAEGEYKMLWSNLDPAVHGCSYDYRVRLLVDNKTVVHDPTVQNDPPPPTTFP